jgi:hypothetical protein
MCVFPFKRGLFNFLQSEHFLAAVARPTITELKFVVPVPVLVGVGSYLVLFFTLLVIF